VSEHPNATSARRGFEAFRTGDLAAIAELIDENAVWRVGGRSPFAGERRGRNAILGFLAETARASGGTYRTEPLWVVADDERVVAAYRATGEREGRILDLEQLLLVRVQGGRWVEVTAVPTDQYAFDAFWS